MSSPARIAATVYESRHHREARLSFEIDPTALDVGAERNLVHDGPRGSMGSPLCEHPRCNSEAVGPFDHRCYRHFGVVTLDDLDATLDAWLDVRVAAHRARGAVDANVRAIDVPLYLRLLRVVRQVEDTLEPWRSTLGATATRAYELVTTAEQLALDVVA